VYPLPHLLVGNAEHDDVGDGRVQGERVLDLPG